MTRRARAGDFRETQFLTIEELFEGRKPHLPWNDPTMFRKAKGEEQAGDAGGGKGDRGVGMAEQFTRRSVNLALLGVAVGLATLGRARLAAATALFDFAIAGGCHNGLQAVAAALRPGARLQLAAEPNNPHDHNAVAVMLDGLRLGYVPRAANAPIAALLAKGEEVRCEVVGRLDRNADLESFAWTVFAEGDPLLRLTLGAAAGPSTA